MAKIHILVKSPPQGRTVWPISTVVKGFHTPNYPTLAFQIWRNSLYRLWSNCWETARRSYTPSFSVHPVGTTMRVIEKLTSFIGLNVLYRRAKFCEDHTTRAGCRCENVVFVFCHAPSPEHCAFGGCIVRTNIALRFIGRFWHGLQLLFRKWLLFQMHYTVHIFNARWRHNLCEIAEKIPKLQKSTEMFVRTTSYR